MSQEMFSSQAMSSSSFDDTALTEESTLLTQTSPMLQMQGEKVSLAQAAKGYVQRHPGRAILFSAAAGLIVSLILPSPTGNPTTPPPRSRSRLR